MTHKLSDWQSGNTIPAQEGTYQRENVYAFGAFYALFKNGEWKIGCATQEMAENENKVSPFQDGSCYWRGIL